MTSNQPRPSREHGFQHLFVPGSSPWTVLLLHGTGGDEHQLVDLGRDLAPHAALLSPRGTVLEGGTMPRFFRRLAVGRLDIPDLLARTDELADFITAASTANGRDPRRIVAVGYSNGANIAASLLLRRPGALRGALLLRPMLPYEPDATPALAGTDVLIVAGTQDPFSALPGVERLAEILRSGGAEVSLHLEPAGHELTGQDIEAARLWLTHLTKENSA